MSPPNLDTSKANLLSYDFVRDIYEYLGKGFIINIQPFMVQDRHLRYQDKIYISNKEGLFILWRFEDNFTYYRFLVFPFYKVRGNIYKNSIGVYYIKQYDANFEKFIIKDLGQYVLL